jgi:hypothetical protein
MKLILTKPWINQNKVLIQKMFVSVTVSVCWLIKLVIASMHRLKFLSKFEMDNIQVKFLCYSSYKPSEVISHEWGKDRKVLMTSGTYPWSIVRQILRNGLPNHGGDRKTFEVMTSTLPKGTIGSVAFHLHMEYISLSWYDILDKDCGSYQDFIDRELLLIRKLLNQWFPLVKLKS